MILLGEIKNVTIRQKNAFVRVVVRRFGTSETTANAWKGKHSSVP